MTTKTQNEKSHRLAMAACLESGEGGIRTHGAREGTLVFETSTIGHSVTSPSGHVRRRIVAHNRCRGNGFRVVTVGRIARVFRSPQLCRLVRRIPLLFSFDGSHFAGSSTARTPKCVATGRQSPISTPGRTRVLSHRWPCSWNCPHQAAFHPRHPVRRACRALAIERRSRRPPETAAVFRYRCRPRCGRRSVFATFLGRPFPARAWAPPGRPIPSEIVAAENPSAAKTFQCRERDGHRSRACRCTRGNIGSQRNRRSWRHLNGRNPRHPYPP